MNIVFQVYDEFASDLNTRTLYIGSDLSAAIEAAKNLYGRHRNHPRIVVWEDGIAIGEVNINYYA